MVERKIIFLDTHAVIWLYTGKKVFGKKSLQLMNESDLRISPIVRLELMLLFRKKRIVDPHKILSSLKKDFYFDEDRIDLSALITKSMLLDFTNDPFDRMIAAHATVRKSYLVTKDSEILKNSKWAVW
jgi:PIN domain nuclease of toxin-antitoxin system